MIRCFKRRENFKINWENLNIFELKFQKHLLTSFEEKLKRFEEDWKDYMKYIGLIKNLTFDNIRIYGIFLIIFVSIYFNHELTDMMFYNEFNSK